MAFITATENKMVFIWCIFRNGKISNPSGPSFCHVHKIKQLIQDRDDIVDGNQKWHGAAPSFSSSANIRSVCISVWLLGWYKNMLEYNITAEPRACARKYLIAASISWFVLCWSINGMKDNRLISIEIQAISQFVLESAIMVLVTKNNENRSDEGIINGTRVWRSWTPY